MQGPFSRATRAWSPFSRCHVLQVLLHCISKGPEGCALVVLAPGFDGVSFQTPFQSRLDDIRLVIKHSLCPGSKPSPPSLQHLPFVDASEALDLFQGLSWEPLLDVLHGFFKQEGLQCHHIFVGDCILSCNVLCQSTTTHGLFFKGLEEELGLSATFSKVLGALGALPSFFKEGSVSSFNWDSCLVSFCFRAASLAAQPGPALGPGPGLSPFRVSFSRSSSAFSRPQCPLLPFSRLLPAAFQLRSMPFSRQQPSPASSQS